ncbi:hypothetical protein SLS62_008638 [Diatrype stigma]|uniref:Uncharacterized protein n=1 Tax=Diatrype stigma TaxID=117547 RepID=A0AAN9UKT2_9PEZI
MLRLNESDLNTQRMFDLMAVRDGPMPLYLYVIQRILRELRISQQELGTSFDYSEFKRMIDAEKLTRDQLVHLGQRLETLESFMVKDDASTAMRGLKDNKTRSQSGTDWIPKTGQLTIVDLSCPCVTSEMACCLFNMCLSLFLEEDPSIGRVIALDEAHKYMGESSECQTLTESLLHTIRLQRHLGARVVISTQEPTISPKLLDLCNVTVVHRFTSPAWMKTLKGHLAGISATSKAIRRVEESPGGDDDSGGDIRGLDVDTADPASELFSRIIQLKVGEALVFAPSAIMGLQKSNTGTATNNPAMAYKRLGHEVLKVSVRKRLTTDGGQSIMAG